MKSMTSYWHADLGPSWHAILFPVVSSRRVNTLEYSPCYTPYFLSKSFISIIMYFSLFDLVKWHFENIDMWRDREGRYLSSVSHTENWIAADIEYSQ